MSNSQVESLQGTVEQIIFYSPDSGYSVCQFLTENGRRLTIVGIFPPVAVGEVLRVKGKWEINPRFGRQFKVNLCIPVLPSSVKGIEKFLSSGLIKGIGPVLAKRIINAFGDKTIEVMSEKPDKLTKVEGIGKVKLTEIKKSWSEHEDIRELVIFLQEHNISTSLATKIYKEYGQEAFKILKSNPYQVCYDIWGIGFKTADQMALKLGLDPKSSERIKAYLHYLLKKDTEEGHVFSWKSSLIVNCQKDLEVDESSILQAVDEMLKKHAVIIENTAGDSAVYLPFFYQAQQEVALLIQKLAHFPAVKPLFDIDKTLKRVEQELRIQFTLKQRESIRKSLNEKILVITGGPGTGKTTIIRAISEICSLWGRQVLLAAPTGRAAKRLSEATGREAKTIHRLLEYNPKTGGFKKGKNRTLSGDLLVIDEFSMVDLPLMHSLLQAVPHWMHLVLVGDKDQLPSVGPGNLLQDIIQSSQVEVEVLDEIFRQEKGSLIVRNAHRVNQGQSLIYPPRGDSESDFYFIHNEDEQKAFQTIMDLCSFRIPKKLSLHPLSPQIQVISPMYRGLVGVDNLNNELQKRLNPRQEGIKLGQREMRLYDKVMQLRNNYEKDVYNGDVGTIIHIDKSYYRIFVDFEGKTVTYDKEELNEITLAYAVSVHKSQGSEYSAVVLPLMTQHFIMLQRNLFYTALTRARRLCVIVGTYKALHIAIKNDKPIQRNTRLKEKLIEVGKKLSFKN